MLKFENKTSSSSSFKYHLTNKKGETFAVFKEFTVKNSVLHSGTDSKLCTGLLLAGQAREYAWSISQFLFHMFDPKHYVSALRN